MKSLLSIVGKKESYRSLVFLFVVSLLPAITAQAQWTRQSPSPTHLDVRGVGAPTTQRVFIATDDDSFDDGGSLFESTDGGLTWGQLNIPTSLSNPFNGLFFLDQQNGWVYGNENYRTTDGGTTWTQLPFLGSTYFMRFYTTAFGLARGNFGSYVSYDGGASWVPSPEDIFSFDFVDDLNGLGVAETGVYKSSDGGVTFSIVQPGGADAVAFLTSTVAVGIVDDGFVYSSDGGATWIPGVAASGRTRLQAVSADAVLAWGRTGSFPNYDDRVLRSSDGGQSWVDLGEVAPAGVFAFAVADPFNVVTADLSGNMFHSADAGLNWTQAFTSRGQQPGYLSSATPDFRGYSDGLLRFWCRVCDQDNRCWYFMVSGIQRHGTIPA